MPSIREVMTLFPDAIEASEGIGAAREMMERLDIRHLPVKEDGELVGIVSERDMLRANEVRDDGSRVTVGMVCTRPPFTVDIDARLDVVAVAMGERKIGSALVTSNGALVGILTTTDLCLLLGRHLAAESRVSG
jgi:acetoin utilization protein AcuB